MLRAINHAYDFQTGQNRPQSFWCMDDDDDDQLVRWVLKLMGLASGELAADWIGSFLAHRLGIRCPPIQIAEVSSDALRTAPRSVQEWARPGPAFASCEMIHAESGLRDDVMAERAEPDFLGALYALDAWLDVLDRRVAGGWNALLDTQAQRVCAIDFGKGLTPCVQKLLGPPIDMTVVNEPSYGTAVTSVASRNASLATCATIEGVDRTEIEAICASVPQAWVDQATREKIAEFLLIRQPRVRDVCSRLPTS